MSLLLIAPVWSEAKIHSHLRKAFNAHLDCLLASLFSVVRIKQLLGWFLHFLWAAPLFFIFGRQALFVHHFVIFRRGFHVFESRSGWPHEGAKLLLTYHSWTSVLAAQGRVQPGGPAVGRSCRSDDHGQAPTPGEGSAAARDHHPGVPPGENFCLEAHTGTLIIILFSYCRLSKI